MKQRLRLAVGAVFLGLVPPAAAQPGHGAGIATPVGERYVVLELFQPHRNLNESDPYLNVLVDVRNARSWALRYTNLPGTNERGYVWVEVPFASAAKGSR
jgi:hypothetical protein